MLVNLSKIRCRKLHWMSEATWNWHIIFTDHMSNLIPTTTPGERSMFSSLKTTAANRRSACSNIHMPSDKL